MSTTNGQSTDDTQSVKARQKPRRKKQQTVGQMLRDFLERTGLNDDIEDAVAHVARHGINTLWKTFQPIEPGQEGPKLPPEEPRVVTATDDPEVTGNNGSAVDLLSNGFKWRGGYDGVNGPTANMVYAAFAENPFVTSTGIPATAR